MTTTQGVAEVVTFDLSGRLTFHVSLYIYQCWSVKSFLMGKEKFFMIRKKLKMEESHICGDYVLLGKEAMVGKGDGSSVS